jgi:hypothetical protein
VRSKSKAKAEGVSATREVTVTLFVRPRLRAQ